MNETPSSNAALARESARDQSSVIADVQAAATEIVALDQVDVAEHPRIYRALHQRLQDALNGSANSEAPVSPS